MTDDFWKGKNVLVTGATGILGSWVTEILLNNGADVIAIMRDTVPKSYFNLKGFSNKVKIVRGVLEDYPLVERAMNEYEVDTCIHLGAQAIVSTANRQPLSTFESNIKGTWNVLEAVRNSKLIKRVVVASSDKAYGSHDNLPYKEDFPLKGLHPYDASKTCTDILAQSYGHSYGLPISITRCGNIYGGGDLNFNRIVPGTIKSLILGEKPIIRSDGTFLRDYFYVKDAANACLTLAKNSSKEGVAGQAFNFGTERPISVLDVVKMLTRISGKDLEPVILDEVKNEIKDQYLDCGKARSVLNWKHEHELEVGLKETYDWYSSFFANV